MDQLQELMHNVEKDKRNVVLEVLKDGEQGRTEKILSAEGLTYIRKYLPEGSNLNEVMILRELEHPSLPKVIDSYQIPGFTVLIEEKINGQSLENLIKSVGKLSVDQAVSFVRKVCDVVDFLHNRKNPIIHRDIKPSNIIVGHDGAIHLIDFGISRVYKEESAKDTVWLGTLGYAPPEQFGFSQTDIRTDIYAIGITFIHMLTGRPPERGERPSSSIEADGQLLEVIKRTTELEPDKRYQTVVELKKGLSNIQIVQTESRVLPFWKVLQSHRSFKLGFWILLLIVLMLIAKPIVDSFWSQGDPLEPNDHKQEQTTTSPSSNDAVDPETEINDTSTDYTKDDKKEEGNKGTRSNPIPFKETVILEDKNRGATFELTMFEVIRGEEADKRFTEERSSLARHDSAPEGYERVFVKARVKLTKMENTDESFILSDIRFKMVSSDGDISNDYTPSLDPRFRFELYEGNGGEGYIAGFVKADQKAQLRYDSSDQIFFALD